ncbi:MAG: flavodoxin-dependent (E)-4-hydroxy-3-methylbut-2-enyl-diphosphate synthase [Clostridiales bacterium]|nr:flavodoxin-dependent (E)-4-hydroxy-3-methylbut-2-enyl-diphosphate synthase [Clostridiales bacterium]
MPQETKEKEKLTLRAQTRRVMCGDVPIGGGANIPVQSMTNTFTEEAAATAAQIQALENAGADIVRCAVPSLKAALALHDIRSRLSASGSSVPIVADIHFDYRIALAAIKAGVEKIRINPGNIGGTDRVKAVADAAGAAGIPIRIGVNSGSIEEDLLPLFEEQPAKALCESALRNIALVQSMHFEDIVLSIKSPDVAVSTEAHKMLAAATDLPLHIGITEAGYGRPAIVKSAAGIGALLAMGIGDTIRVSLTGDPVKEIPAAREILRALGLLPGGVVLISCPTCGRCRVDIEKICGEASYALSEIERIRMLKARRIRRKGPLPEEGDEAFGQRLSEAERTIVVAVMGCRVNGPGEASHADLGVACGAFGGLYFEKGVSGDVVPEEKIVTTLIDGIERLTL